MSRLCFGFDVHVGGGLPLIECECACLLDGFIENEMDSPRIVLACATTRCDLVCSLIE